LERKKREKEGGEEKMDTVWDVTLKKRTGVGKYDYINPPQNTFRVLLSPLRNWGGGRFGWRDSGKLRGKQTKKTYRVRGSG